MFWSNKDRERISAAEAKRNKNDVIGTDIQELTAKNKKEEQHAKQKKQKNAKQKPKNNSFRRTKAKNRKYIE